MVSDELGEYTKVTPVEVVDMKKFGEVVGGTGGVGIQLVSYL